MWMRAALLASLGLSWACGGDDGAAAATSATGAGSGGSGGQPFPDVGAYLPCPAGELELSDGTCQAPGVPAAGCAMGFDHDGNGGCVPILPRTPCGSGQMALPGETSCRDVAPCESGKWGDIPVDATTEHVDQSYTGGGNNGSSAQPWTTIGAAVTAAQNGAIIAIAQGSYAEAISVSVPVKLWGTCPTAVQINAPSFSDAVFVGQGASGTEIHRVSLSGYEGVYALGATVLVDQVHIHDTAWDGVYAQRAGGVPANVTLRRSLVERATTVAVTSIGSTLLVEESLIRETRSTTGGTFGRAISIESELSSGARASATIRRTVVLDNRESGISVHGSDAVIEDSLVQGTASQPSNGGYGNGIGAWAESGSGSALTVTRSVSLGNRLCGICATDSQLTVDSSVARGTLPEESSMEAGYGMRIYSYGPMPAERPSAVVRQSLVDGAYQGGLMVVGSDAEIETTEVRGVEPRASDGNFGRGMSIEVSYDNLEPAFATLRGVRVDSARDVGIFVVGADVDMDSVHVRAIRSRENDGIFGAGIAYATEILQTKRPSSGTVARVVVEDCQAGGFGVAGATVVATDLIVADTAPQAYDSNFGDGIVVSSFLILIPDIVPTSLELTRGTVRGNARAGIGSFGASVAVGESLLDCNAIQLDGEEIQGEAFQFEDRGGNVCLCGDMSEQCQVLTSGLRPPSPVGL